MAKDTFKLPPPPNATKRFWRKTPQSFHDAVDNFRKGLKSYQALIANRFENAGRTEKTGLLKLMFLAAKKEMVLPSAGGENTKGIRIEDFNLLKSALELSAIYNVDAETARDTTQSVLKKAQSICEDEKKAERDAKVTKRKEKIAADKEKAQLVADKKTAKRQREADAAAKRKKKPTVAVAAVRMITPTPPPIIPPVSNTVSPNRMKVNIARVRTEQGKRQNEKVTLDSAARTEQHQIVGDVSKVPTKAFIAAYEVQPTAVKNQLWRIMWNCLSDSLKADIDNMVNGTRKGTKKTKATTKRTKKRELCSV